MCCTYELHTALRQAHVNSTLIPAVRMLLLAYVSPLPTHLAVAGSY
jgi:hypothetical protein